MTETPKFPFAKNDRSTAFCYRVRDALVVFADKSPEEALALVRSFWEAHEDIEEDELLYHEPPYYYAMCIAHHRVLGDGKDMWWLDGEQWPPPKGWKLE